MRGTGDGDDVQSAVELTITSSMQPVAVFAP